LLEQIGARHGDDTGFHASIFKLFGGFKRDGDFGAGSDQYYVGYALAIA
jgi:hypothetical protein